MRHRSLWFFSLVAGIASFLPVVAAENSILIRAFGGDPGSPLPHAYSYGLPELESPTYSLRIPVIDPDLKPVFYDTELTIAHADKIVQNVRAARAYRSMVECEAARELVRGRLAQALPVEASSSEGHALHRSVDGRVTGLAVCDSPRHYPMPVLRLDIFVSD